MVKDKVQLVNKLHESCGSFQPLFIHARLSCPALVRGVISVGALQQAIRKEAVKGSEQWRVGISPQCSLPFLPAPPCLDQRSGSEDTAGSQEDRARE